MTKIAPTTTTCIRTLLLAAGLALGTAAAAQAATFTWDFSGTIAAPSDATTNLVSSGGGTSTLTWGSNEPESSLTIDSSAGSTSVAFGTTEEVLIGSLSWTNMSVFDGGGVWTTVLSLNGIFEHDGFGPVSDTAFATIEMDNTTDVNTNPDTNNQTGQNPDFISLLTLNLAGLTTPLDLGGGMTLLGFSARITDAGQCGTANSSSIGSFITDDGRWSNCEGNTSVLGIYADVNVIPLPAAGWLLLSGLGALAVMRRRRKAA